MVFDGLAPILFEAVGSPSGIYVCDSGLATMILSAKLHGDDWKARTCRPAEEGFWLPRVRVRIFSTDFALLISSLQLQINVFDQLDLLVIPVCYASTTANTPSWRLCVVDFKAQMVSAYDPLDDGDSSPQGYLRRVGDLQEVCGHAHKPEEIQSVNKCPPTLDI